MTLANALQNKISASDNERKLKFPKLRSCISHNRAFQEGGPGEFQCPIFYIIGLSFLCPGQVNRNSTGLYDRTSKLGTKKPYIGMLIRSRFRLIPYWTTTLHELPFTFITGIKNCVSSCNSGDWSTCLRISRLGVRVPPGAPEFLIS